MSKLIRSSNEKVLYGVCSGIADYFSISTFLVRLVFLLTISVSIWVYIVLSMYLDEGPTYSL
ncbi:PspC domain-containing protein [Paenalkalicoccus suaedae]|uniref:PspC domain-containing protein n=1 Tax=Paenalkalicoccus suaedae TaxID=2592382 RepID=A0A859FAM8_9BACI|nr:PspC domain-containing protein [Paenalkalicoccus suaedae]QKS69980.1 PspC domain-containing protein [Paenalkalicoccus suaedae]